MIQHYLYILNNNKYNYSVNGSKYCNIYSFTIETEKVGLFGLILFIWNLIMK